MLSSDSCLATHAEDELIYQVCILFEPTLTGGHSAQGRRPGPARRCPRRGPPSPGPAGGGARAREELRSQLPGAPAASVRVGGSATFFKK